MAGLPTDHEKARIEAMQMASINMDSRLSMIENLMTDNYGRIAMNQDDLMRQLMDRSVAAGSSIDMEAMEKLQQLIVEQEKRSATPATPYGVASAPSWGRDASDSVVSAPLGFPGSPGRIGSAPLARGVDRASIEHILKIREKLDDFLDGSNVLVKIMNPQTIREMVREMRQEIRAIKKEESISELDIVNHLEEELADEENRRADARARIDKYDADNEVPF